MENKTESTLFKVFVTLALIFLMVNEAYKYLYDRNFNNILRETSSAKLIITTSLSNSWRLGSIKKFGEDRHRDVLFINDTTLSVSKFNTTDEAISLKYEIEHYFKGYSNINEFNFSVLK